MTDQKKEPTQSDTSHSVEDDERWANQLGDVNEGHDEAALKEASERMLLRKDRT